MYTHMHVKDTQKNTDIKYFPIIFVNILPFSRSVSFAFAIFLLKLMSKPGKYNYPCFKGTS